MYLINVLKPTLWYQRAQSCSVGGWMMKWIITVGWWITCWPWPHVPPLTIKTQTFPFFYQPQGNIRYPLKSQSHLKPINDLSQHFSDFNKFEKKNAPQTIKWTDGILAPIQSLTDLIHPTISLSLRFHFSSHSEIEWVTSPIDFSIDRF